MERLSSNFEMRRLTDFYYSWTAAIADINHDGHPDVIAGPYYYLGPDFTTAREFYTPAVYNPATDYPQVSIVSVAYDFTGDGWPDILLMSGNAGISTVTLYVNPRGESRHWDHYVVLKPIGNEETLLKDIDGDGKPELIHSLNNNVLAYSKPDPANPTGTWKTTIISEPGPWGYLHRSWSGRGRRERRRAHGFPELLRLVGTAGQGQHPNHLDLSSRGLWPLGLLPGRTRRGRDWRV